MHGELLIQMIITEGRMTETHYTVSSVAQTGFTVQANLVSSLGELYTGLWTGMHVADKSGWMRE